MSDIKTILQEFVATANDPKVGSAEKALGYFPEFEGYDKNVLAEYVATANDPKVGGDFEKVNSYFPELFKQASGGAPMRPEQTVPSLVPGMEFPVQEAPKAKPVVGVIGNTLRGANGLIGMPEVGKSTLNLPDPKTGAFTPEIAAAYRGEKTPKAQSKDPWAAMMPPPEESNFFTDMWKGARIGSKTALAEVGIAFEDQAAKIGNAIKSISDNPGWQAYWDKEIAIGEGHGETFKDIRRVSNAEAQMSMKGTPGEFIGGMVPFVGTAAAAILLKNPTLATATTGVFGEMGYGAGISAYDDYKASTGEPINELERTGAGVLYGAAMTLPMTKYIGKLGGKAVEKVIPKVIQQTLASNPEGTAALGKQIIENFLVKQPTLAKKLITTMGKSAAHGVATMEAMELSKKAVDEFLIGRDVNAKEWWDTITHSAVSGVAFGLMTAPFGMYAQNRNTIQRREQQGQVTLTQDAKGNPIEIIPNTTKGVTPEGKLVDLTQDQIKNSFTLTTKDFNEATKIHKQTGEVPADIERTAYSGNMLQFLNRVSVEGNLFVPKSYADGTGEVKRTEDGLIMPVYTKDKDGNFIGFDKEGRGYKIENPGELIEVDALDVHKSMMDMYDAQAGKASKAEAVRTSIQAEHERVSTEIAAIANKDMQEVQTVKLATGEVVNLTGGRIARKEDGTLDFDNSDKVLYYTNAEGVTKPVSIGMVESLETAQPLESAIAEAQEAVTTVEIGKANYPQGDSFVLLNADGTPQLGETGQPVATTIAGVDQTGVTLTTAEGQEVKLSFEEADTMLAPLSEHLPNLTGKRYQVNGLEMVVTGVNEKGQYEVQVWNKDSYLGEEAVSAQELSALEPQQPQQVAGLTENVLTENVNTQTVNTQTELPIGKDGGVDYNSISDPQTYAEALTQEFGEDAGIVATELLDEAKDELEKARAKTNAIERRRGMKAATDKIALLEGVKTALQPKAEMPVVNLDDIAPETVNNETEKDLSLLTLDEVSSLFENSEGSTRLEAAYHMVGGLEKAFSWDKPTVLVENTEAFIKNIETWTGESIDPEDLPSYNKAAGAAVNGKAFINLGKISKAKTLQAFWMHEQGHTASRELFSDAEFEEIFNATNRGVLKYITGGNYEKCTNAEIAQEAISHALEFYSAMGVDRLVQLEVNDIHPALEGQDALNEAIFKTLRVLTNNDKHGKSWSENQTGSTSAIKSDGTGSTELSGASVEGTGGNDNTGAQNGNNEPGTEEVRREPNYSNGAQVNYKGETYTINGVARDLESGAISYDLETPEGKIAFEEVPEAELLSYNGATEPATSEVAETTIVEAEPTTTEVVETVTADPLQSLKDEHSKMLEDAAAIRDEAAKITGPERFKAYGRAGAILSKAKKLAEKIAELEATAVDKAVVEQQPNLNPTEAQKVAGNYKKTHVTVQGLEITIENPKGSIRKGVDEDGKAWENEVKSHYGYFKRTEGKDGDHVDVFVGDKLESPKVFVIDQVFDKGPKSGLFDESKVMIGFETLQEATDAYMANYAPDWKGLSNITEVSVDFFKEWLYDGKKQGKPFADYKGVKAVAETKTTQKWDKNNPPIETWRNEFEKAVSENDIKSVKEITSSIRISKNALSKSNPLQKELTSLLNSIENSDIVKADKALEQKKQAAMAEYLKANKMTMQQFQDMTTEKQNAVKVDFKKWLETKYPELSPLVVFKKGEQTSEPQSQAKEQRAAQKNDKIYDIKKGLWAVVARTYKPAKGSALENEPYLMDVHYSDGSRATNMPMNERYSFEGPADKGNPTPVVKTVEPNMGDSLSAFKQGDTVKRIYDGKTYEIISDKGDLWKLKDTESGIVSTWNASNNGGFSIVEPTDPTPDKPTKKVEYKDGRTAEGREAAMQALRDKLAAEKAKNAPGGNVANLRMVDTVILSAGFEVAPYIFDEGNIAFPDFANALISEVGDDIIPHLQGIYLGVKYTPTAAEIRGDMSDIAEIEGYIKDLLDKQNNSGKTDVSLQSEKGDTFLKDHIIVAKPGLTPTNNETNSGRMGDSSPVEISGKPSSTTTGVSQGEPRDAATVDRGQSANRTGVDEERTGTQGGSSVREGSSNINAGASGGTVGSTGSANKREQNEGNSQAITSTGPRNSRNYVIPRGADVAPRGDVSKVRANIAAIKLAKKLAESGLTATPEQMEVLVKYTGWGGLSNVFKQADPSYQAVRDALTDEEYDAARASTTTAFYTPPAVIAATWDAIEQLGFKGGEILEPSGGIGHFFGLMPANIASVSNLRGVELDNISGLIFKALYPDAKIAIEGFEKQRIANNSLDLVVTNVPFGDFKVHDKEDKDLSSQFNIHDYFIAKGVRKLKPGGIGVFITTSSTLDKSSGLRSWVINEGNADFIDAVRLNSDTFKQAAGTEATADIIIIRKRDVNGKPDYAKNMQDVVNLREASYMEDKKTSWGGYAGTEEKKVQMRINKFFADNPDRMAGEMKFGFEGGNAIRPTEQRLAPVKGIDQAQVLADFAKGLPANAFGAKAVTSRKVVESDGTKEGGLTVINGVPYIIRFGEAVATGWNENKVKGSTKAQVVEQYAGIKKTLNELLDAERVDSPTMEGLRKELNKKYDKFVDQFGPLSKNNNLVFLRSDVDFPAISAIEDVKTSEDPETGKRVVEVTKSDIFSKRVMNPEQILKADNVEDAMRVSMYKHGAVDLNYIQELTGISPEDAKKEIVEKRIGFVNPTTGLVETRKDYLSGNVRVKLEQAEQANENNDYDSNVEELSKVIPLDVPQHMIKAALGSTWIPMEAYEHFFKETFGVEGKIIKTSSDKYLANLRGENNAKDAELGVPGHPGSTLALNYMNNKPTIVYRYEGYGRDRKQVKDAAASTEAATKAADIAEAFDNWARSNANPFGEKMTAAYNKIFNAVVEPKRDVAKAYDRGFAIVKESPYFQEALAKEPEVERATAMAFVAAVQDMGAKLPEAVKAEFESIRGQVVFPGQATSKVLRAHQVEGVLRGLQASTLLAHEVGTGKTMTLITTAMEMRRLGMAKKPCIVVQRATYEQFVKEIKELYPQAKVLVPASDDLKASERQQLFAKIAYNDWDIVVLYHGYLDAIPDDPNRVNQYIDELIQEKLDLMEEISASGDVNSKRMAAGIATQIKGLEGKYLPTDNKAEAKKEKSIKDIEKARAKAGTKAETLLDRRTDNTLTFEQLGIDALLIDEAHAYKKLGFNTALQSVKGVDTGASQRAQSMRLKSSYILENNNGKNVIFATGTPISNTFAEMWTFLRYLMPKSELSRLQMNNFDAFVNNFGNIEESVEFSASGKFKPTTRFTGFANVPELISAWKQVAHTVLTEDIPTLREGVGTPVVEGGKPTDVVLKQSPSLKGVMRSIKDVLTNFENMSGAEKKENKHIPIVMFQVAKRAAIDVRLVDSALPDEPLSKTNQTVALVLADLEKTKDYKGTVAVFCDALQSRDGKFKIFEDIKAKLIKAGVPENQIAIVQDLKDDKREAVWDKVNAGDIRVVMGSTEKMGVGVNIQKRLHALIHMDVPVRPSDYQQRNGRIIRQGNLHLDMRKNIEVLRLGVVQTLDVTGYNRLDIKKKGSDQIMKGSNDGREMEEEDVDGVSDSSNFSETMGKISGSQAAMLLATERTKLKKLENSAYYHDQNQIHIASELKYNANMIPATEARIKELEAQKEKLNTLFGGTELRTLKVGDKEVSFDDEAGVKALLSAAGKAAEKEADRLKADPDRMAENTSKLSSKISINGVEFEVTTYVKKGYNITEGKPTSSKKVVYSCDALRGFISSDPSKDRWDIENGLLLSGDAGAKIDNLLPSLEDFVATKALDRGIQRRKSSIEDAKRATEVYKGQLGKPFPKAAELERVRANVAALEIQMKKELEEIEAEEVAEIAAGKITAIDISGAVESEDGGVMELPPNPAESYYSIDAASGNFVVRRDAKPIELEDKGEYFIYEIDGRYYIAEATTGIGITSSYRENTAVNDANMKIKRTAENGKPIEQFIQERADKAGYSPRYIARNKPMLRIAGDTPKGTVTVNGVERPVLNSNGKLIHSTEEGIRNFYNWFGDSVVKNKKGQAAVMYHGTNADFSEFDSRMGGTNTGAKNGVLGSFFTDSPKVSQSFGNIVMPVYLKLEKPIEIGYFAYDAYGNIDKNKTVDGYEGIKAAITKIAKKESYADVTDEDILNWKELVKKLGYDGLVIETQVDATEVVSTGKMAGYVKPHKMHIVFEPSQIKSATGNDGGFDPDNNDIRFRLITIPEKPKFKDFNGDLKAYALALKDFTERTSEVVPAMEAELNSVMNKEFDEFLRNQQDADLPIKNLQNFVAEQGGTVKDIHDAYNDKNRSIGRSTYKAQEFEKNEIKNLADAYKAIIKESKLETLPEVPLSEDTTPSIRKIGAYLQAKDIVEALNLGLVDRGELGFLQDVGVTAQEYIKAFETAVAPALVTNLHKAVKAATLYGLDRELEAGLMTDEDYANYAARQYYVPQRGWEERDSKEGETHYLKQGHVYGDPYNAVLVKAKGRESLASDPLKYIQSMGHSAILTGEKNLYKQKALQLVKDNIEIGRASGGFNFKRVWYVNTGTKDAGGNIIYDEVFERPAQQLFDEDVATYALIKQIKAEMKIANEAAAIDELDDLRKLLEEAVDNIHIKFKVNDAYKRQRTSAEAVQHEVVVYVNGERMVVYFKDERLANALNNKSEEFTLPRFMQLFGKATRFYSSIMTQYNPAFAGWNFMRDFQLANIALFAEQGPQFAAKFNKNIFDPAVSGAIWRHIAGKENFNKANHVMLKNFFEDGAATGFTYLKDLDQIQKDLRKAIEPTLLQSTAGSQLNVLNGKAVGKAFAALTEYSELVTRFATYKTALEMGRSREQAATIAKDVTVNFNRKGANTKILSSLFAFYNASVQGTYRASRLAEFGKVFGSVVAIMVVGGFLNTIFNPNDPEDEKNWSEYDRMQNVILFGVKLPVTHFFRGFWAMGAQTALAYQGEKSVPNALFDAAKAMTSEIIPAVFNPLNAARWDAESGIEWRTPREGVPSVIAPMVDVAINESFTGARVYREPITDGDKIPQSFLGKRDVSPLTQSISNFLLEAGGGDSKIKDLYQADGSKVNTLFFDVNPSAMEYLATSYTGGVGKFAMDSYKSIAHIAETGEVDVARLPIVNRAVKPYNEDRVFYAKYSELMNKVKAFENSTSVRKKAFVQEGEAYNPAISDFLSLMTSQRGRMVFKAKALQKQVESLQDVIDTMRANGKAKEADSYSKELTSKVKEVNKLLEEWNNIKE